VKAHPLLVRLLDCLSAQGGAAYLDWNRAGCPATEEEPIVPGKIYSIGEMSHRIESLERDLAAALQKAEDWRQDSKREESLKNAYLKDLAAANARIKELEARGGHLCVHSGLWQSVANGKDYICPDCRNAALEEAAHYVERLGLHPDFNPEQHAGVCVTVIRDGSKVAAGIRGLKK
jgi:hypothetical protein